MRKLPKGTRTITGREARFISVHDAEPNSERVVDCHIAPYENTRYTGERMFAAAVEVSVAGAWEEKNAPLLLSLLAVRASGWWDDFWQWRTERDRQAWHDRQDGKIKMIFRGKRGKGAKRDVEDTDAKRAAA